MGKNWAITIGINQYDNLQPLNFAKRDAEAMDAWFREEARFNEVFLFSDDSPPINTSPPIPTQPTYGRLRRFLQAQFEQPLLNPGDNLWFFFAGHGKRHADKDYLMLSDSDPGDVEHTAISVEYVTERLRRCGADNVVLLLDACREESSRSGLGIGTENHQGVITFYSCAANQKSWEIGELQHGSFTHALLEGLRLNGEANCATVERLDRYLNSYVPQLNARYQKPIQNPYLKAEPPYKMYYILLDQSATLKDVEPLKYRASTAENEGNIALAEQLWIRVLGVSRADLDAISAIQRIAIKKNTSTPLPIPQPIVNLPTPGSSRGEATIEPASILKPDKKTKQKEAASQKRHKEEAERVKQQQQAGKIKQEQETLEPLQRTINLITSALNVNRRQFLTYSGLGGIGLVTASVLNKIFNTQAPKPEPIATFQPTPTSEQKSKLKKSEKFITVTVDEKGNVVKRNLKNQVSFFTEDLGNGISLEMVQIPAGSFKMGSPPDDKERKENEEPQRIVNVPAFFMGRFEITQEQYQKVMGKNPANFKGNKRPVEKVSWDDAMEFCKKLSQKTGRTYRLPSEAEWEYACRAGTNTPFYFGETITTNLANYDGKSAYGFAPKGEYRAQTTQIGSFPPNAFGLYDMHGNVWEWCADTWQKNYQGAPIDGSAWKNNNSKTRSLRGGSWSFSPNYSRSAYRIGNDHNYRDSNIGFRVVCNTDYSGGNPS